MIDPSECRAAVAALGAARARLDEVKDPSIDPLKQYVSEAIVALNEKAATNVSLPPDTDRLAAALELRGRALRFVTGTSTAPGACPEKPGAARLGNHADSQAAPAGVTLRALRLVGLVLPDKRSELTKMEPRVRTDPGYEKDQLRWLIPFFEAKHQKFCVGLSPTCLPPPDDDIKDLKARQCELLQGAAREPAATPK
jgi:hypothetical protein